MVASFFGMMPSGLVEHDKGAMVVVIDGPAGAGKTTIARRLAARLGLSLLDTGAIYRTLALAALRNGVSWDDEEGLARLCVGLPIAFSVGVNPDAPQKVLLGPDDVTERIRTAEISNAASIVSAHPAVRAALLDIQRRLGAAGCVAEGRDMGTVVFPDAPHKFFVTASPGVRATRRRAERLDRGEPDVPSLEDVMADMKKRDVRDSTRAAAPLAQADDAELVDTSQMGTEAVIEHILGRIAGSSSAG